MVNIAYNDDCMSAMKKMPDKAFDLAIVDPPYFEKAGDPAYYRSGLGTSKHKPITKTWEVPGEEYFNELFRVSKKQIIWGCNYYAKYIPHTSRIVWDKVSDGTPFSQADLASWSDGVKIYMFRYMWNGMLQENMANKEVRIHPTQKPVALYIWLLKTFAKQGWKILDTHLGSGSSRIAAYDLGYDFTGYEIDSDYYKLQEDRLRVHTSQMSLFEETYAT